MKRSDEQEFLESIYKYTQECLKVCTQKSEQAVFVVDKTLQFLVEDANRISMMSKETLDVLASTRDILQKDDDPQNLASPIRHIVKVLRKLKADHGEIDSLIMPIIQSLQFQDRVRQQMENSAKMIVAWLDLRKTLNGRKVTPEERDALGKAFMGMTTTEEERVAIREGFPGVKEEAIVSNDDFFF